MEFRGYRETIKNNFKKRITERTYQFYLDQPSKHESVLKFKNWCSSCVEYLVSGKTEWNDDDLTILNADKTFDEESLKGMIAALTFILEKTAKSDCSARDLELEMQQLGLPPEHCKQLTKAYAVNLERLKSALLLSFPRAPSLAISSVDAKEGKNGKIYVMNMLSNNGEDISVALNDAKLNYLVQELSGAMDIIRPFVRNASSDAH